jgi:glycerate dehydrogenase
MKIVVLDGFTLNPGDNPWDGVAALGDFTVYEKTLPEFTVERAAGADILLTNKTILSAEVLDQLPDVKFIAVLATGYNVVDLEAARARGISVSNVPVYGTTTVGQYVFALLLEFCHHVVHHAERVRDGEWARRGEFCFWDYPLVELHGMTMGIVGFGRIGRRTGELAHAFGMHVIVADVIQGDAPDYEPFAWKSVAEVFADADVVSLHCPQTPENTEFVNKALLDTMKSSAILINTARGGLIHEQDLADALNEGRIAGAALDVVSKEPVEESNPLFGAKNLILTPHMAWGTLGARNRLMNTTVENVKAFMAGSPQNVVNP